MFVQYVSLLMEVTDGDMGHAAHSGLAEASLVFILVELFGGCFCASWFNAVVFDTSTGNMVPVSLIQTLILAP